MSDLVQRIADVMGCQPDDDDDLVEAVRLLVAERDEALKEAAWLCGLLKECATLLCNEGIPTPARQIMLARIHAALEGLGGCDAS